MQKTLKLYLYPLHLSVTPGSTIDVICHLANRATPEITATFMKNITAQQKVLDNKINSKNVKYRHYKIQALQNVKYMQMSKLRKKI